MHIKGRLVLLLLPFLFLLSVFQVSAATVANTFQITTNGSQQKDPIIYKNLVLYTNFGGTQGIDIWKYNLNNQNNKPLIEKPGDQFLTGFFENLVLYDDIPPSETTSDVRLYDTNNKKDILIAGGAISHTGGVTNGKYVAYLDGGACGPIHLYNLKKKLDMVISPNGCGPLRISEKYVIWGYGASGGSNLYGYNLSSNQLFDVVTNPGFQESMNIFEDNVVYLDYVTGSLGDYNAIKMKDLKTGEERTIYQSTTSTLQWPAASNKYVVWSESTAQHVGGVQAANLKTGEVFEVQAQGPHQNSHTMPAIWKNMAVWMAWRTGSGDIYGSEFSKN